MKRCAPIIAAVLAPLVAHAGSSTHYSLDPVTVNYGGLTASSPTYSADVAASPGGAGESPSYTAPSGFADQVAGAVATAIALALGAATLSLSEVGVLQLTATLVFDDSTTTPLDPATVTWSVASGPLSGVNADGLAAGAAVAEDSIAVVQANYQSFSKMLNLTVLNTLPDNFGSYASDGLNDDWQIQYFGFDNPMAAPLVDADYDGQNNLFEYTAGIIPTDRASRFQIDAKAVTGQPTQKDIVFGPRFNDRSYTIETSTTLLGGSWTPLVGGIVTDNATTRTITDPNASGVRKFYRIEITKP